MSTVIPPTEPQGSIVLYTTPDGVTQLDVKLENETVWLSQQQMAMLFDVEENNITYHIQKILKSGELQRESTTLKIRVVRMEGNRQVTRPIDFYNLDMIISVGYRVNSKNATQFRIWATTVLKQYLVKGYAINQQLLKITLSRTKQLNVSNKSVSLHRQNKIENGRHCLRLFACI